MHSLLRCVCVLAFAFAPYGYAEGVTEEPAEDNEVTFADLFRETSVKTPRLSPDGEHVAYFRFNMLVIGEPRGTFEDIREFSDWVDIRGLSWIGHDTVLVESWDNRYGHFWMTAVRFRQDAEGNLELDEIIDHDIAALLIDPVFANNNRMTIAKPRWEDDLFAADLYSIDVFKPIENQLKKSNRIDTGSDQFYAYARDADGNYVLAIRFVAGVPEIWQRPSTGDEWVHTWTADREKSFLPVSMSADARTLWVLTSLESDRVVAAAFDLGTKQVTETLFEHDRVDVDSIIMSHDGREPVGVTYTEQGLVQYHYFSDAHAGEFESIRAHFPELGVIRIGSAPDTGRQLVVASSPSLRGEIHVCDTREDWCELIESVAPWLENKPLSETVAFDVQSTDDIVVEAFLTLPVNTEGDIPLIALPHGGPIGISDVRYFSGEVQWLAHNGYAVLQVNYRGSGGYGQTFENAGLRQWGRGIEDDIEASVYKVLEDYPQLDGDRVGIFGGSYGGYSAIMSVIRNPELFKCAASYAGVMDLTLLFTESTTRQNNYLREILVRYVGDPDIDYAEQREHSPVYRYEDINRPILLGHGLDDEVADFEHSWRLRKMLRLRGVDPEFVILRGVGHSFDYISEAEQFYGPLVEFLDRHLKPAT